jgi:D-alanyl-D-alanine dipeptidase
MRYWAFILAMMLAAAPAVRTLAQPAAAHRHAGQAPAPPPSEIAGLIGQYGTGITNLLDVYESGGALYAQGQGLNAALLAHRSGDVWASGAISLAFERRSTTGRASVVTLRGKRLELIDLGALAQARVRAGVRADPARLRAQARAARLPSQPAPKRRSDLVDLASIDPTIRFDIRYATADNFMGIALYERPAAFLQRPAAEALGRVHRSLKSQGYGLMIHDAYRPWFVTWMFWEATPEQNRIFVANPANGSRHNRGAAVDLTLYDLVTGRAVEMPGRYDELSRRSYADYAGGTSRQRWLRALLRQEMEAQGFTALPEEWWHFDYGGWRDWDLGNQTFTELARRP